MATCKFCEMELVGIGCVSQKQANSCNNYRLHKADEFFRESGVDDAIPPDTPSLEDTMPLEYFTERGDE